jgi:hypothetical protein
VDACNAFPKDLLGVIGDGVEVDLDNRSRADGTGDCGIGMGGARDSGAVFFSISFHCR